jgi:hypothetical protein
LQAGIEEDATPSGKEKPLLDMVRISDIALGLKPSEIFATFCRAAIRPLGLVAAIVVDASEGAPQSMAWRQRGTTWHDVELGERRAWTAFAELTLSPDLPGDLTTNQSEPHAHRPLFWTALNLGVPLFGILQFGTSRPVSDLERVLLRCMTVRLSAALHLGRRNAAAR